MRIIALSLLTSVIGMSIPAYADEFGPRFYNKTPAGLADYTIEETPDIAMDEMAEDLQDIMPAAGESQKEEKPEENASKEPENNSNPK